MINKGTTRTIILTRNPPQLSVFYSSVLTLRFSSSFESSSRKPRPICVLLYLIVACGILIHCSPASQGHAFKPPPPTRLLSTVRQSRSPFATARNVPRHSNNNMCPSNNNNDNNNPIMGNTRSPSRLRRACSKVGHYIHSRPTAGTSQSPSLKSHSPGGMAKTGKHKTIPRSPELGRTGKAVTVTPAAAVVSPPKNTSIVNFRPAAGLPGESIVYRCGSTDVLGEKVRLLEGQTNGKDVVNDNDATASASVTWTDADRMVFNEAGLILDLRSPGERNEGRARRWMTSQLRGPSSTSSTTTAPSRPFLVLQCSTDDLSSVTFLLPERARYVVRLDVLNPARFMEYVDDMWLVDPTTRARVLWYKLADGDALHGLRMDALNLRGLAGLNEAILETGGLALCRALQIMTLYREAVTAVPSSTTTTIAAAEKASKTLSLSAVAAVTTTIPSSSPARRSRGRKNDDSDDDDGDDDDAREGASRPTVTAVLVDEDAIEAFSDVGSLPSLEGSDTTSNCGSSTISTNSNSSSRSLSSSSTSEPSTPQPPADSVTEKNTTTAAFIAKMRSRIKARHDIDNERNNNNKTEQSSSSSLPSDTKIVIHCVQGKDRTGMLVMLMQSLMGVSDEVIIEDYYRSNAATIPKAGAGNASAATAAEVVAARSASIVDGTPAPVKGRLDKSIFSGTSREAMITTLQFVREKYGSIVPGYLDSIGFDESWRNRLATELRRGGSVDGARDRTEPQEQNASPMSSPSEAMGATPPLSRL